jgi:hypothetical protein
VCVTDDPTEQGDQPHGKQYMAAFHASKASSKYTSTSGIWATVWLEFVPTTYLSELHIATASVGTSSATMYARTDPFVRPRRAGSLGVLAENAAALHSVDQSMTQTPTETHASWSGPRSTVNASITGANRTGCSVKVDVLDGTTAIGSSLSVVRKTPSLRTLWLATEYLTRQARDTHGNKLTKRTVFCRV